MMADAGRCSTTSGTRSWGGDEGELLLPGDSCVRKSIVSRADKKETSMDLAASTDEVEQAWGEPSSPEQWTSDNAHRSLS
jgi:hypothetical protein